MAIYERTCKTCNRIFIGGPRAWYCPDCREIRRREYAVSFKKHGTKRPLGSTDKCKNCGKEYVVESGRQMYCLACRPSMYKKVDNEQSTKYYYDIVSKDKNKRNTRRRKKYSENKTEINQKRKKSNYVPQPELNITIKELRTKTGMTQLEFAKYFHIPLPTVARWESKNRKPPVYLLELMIYRLTKEKMICDVRERS